MARSDGLTPEELVQVAQTLSKLLNGRVKFAIIGGAACALHRVVNNDLYRGTQDLDLVITPTKAYNAETISNWLATKNPGTVKFVEQYGVMTPAIPIYRGREEFLVEIEIFDVEAWPNRRQYDLADSKANPTTTFSVAQGGSLQPAQQESTGAADITVMHPRWLLREKILSQFERSGSSKEESDILDIEVLSGMVAPQSLVLSSANHINALKALIQKRPDLVARLRKAISCPQVFGN